MKKFKMLVITFVTIFTLVGGSFLLLNKTTENNSYLIASEYGDDGALQNIQFIF